MVEPKTRARSFAFALLAAAACGRNAGQDEQRVNTPPSVRPMDATHAASVGDAQLLWSMETPTANRNVDVAFGSDGAVGIIAAGKVDAGYAGAFLGHAPAASTQGHTGVALIARRDDRGIIWQRRVETNSYSKGLAVTRTHLVAGSPVLISTETPKHQSLFDQVGVLRAPRRGRPPSAVALAPKSDADELLVYETAPPGSEHGHVLGRSGETVVTISALGTSGRVVAWKDQRPLWYAEPANAKALWGAVVDDEIALCLRFKGDAIVFDGHPALPIEGYRDELGSVVVWFSVATGKPVGVLPLRNRARETYPYYCPNFTAVRSGAVIAEIDRAAGSANIKLVRRNDAKDVVLLTVDYDGTELLHVESDGGDQVVVVDQDLDTTVESSYRSTVTVIDTSRNMVRWTGPLPDDIVASGAVALQGDVLLYAGERTKAMVVDGKSLPKPASDASDRGIVGALKLAPLP